VGGGGGGQRTPPPPPNTKQLCVLYSMLLISDSQLSHQHYHTHTLACTRMPCTAHARHYDPEESTGCDHGNPWSIIGLLPAA
jgi:hypothetical protein